MPYIRLAARIILLAFVVVSLTLAYLQPAPMEVAKAYCATKGFTADRLAVLSDNGSNSVITSNHKIEFEIKGAKPRKKVVMELRQAIYFLHWRVVDFHEEPM